MVPGLVAHFDRENNVSVKGDQKTQPAEPLPSSWYTSQEMYELERRAIFSRKWLLITHKLRLSQPGDYLRYDIANNQFVLSRDREGKINAFHNICRHRAFPVVTEERGSARIFSCKYHGWSYGLNGKLAKAPGYQELENFDKSKNGLFPIHVHIDNNGFVWINLNAKQKPEATWEDEFENVDLETRFRKYNFDDYQFDQTLDLEGPYNWKVLADRYNERYHTSPDQSDSTAQTSPVDIKGYSIHHNQALTSDSSSIDVTYNWPNSSTSIASKFFLIQKIVPKGPKTSTIRYEIFRHKDATSTEVAQIVQAYQQTMLEDKELCSKVQQDIHGGEVRSTSKNVPLYFQQLVREVVTEHHQQEQELKQQIWPARQTLPDTKGAVVSEELIDFCTGLACTPNSQKALAW